MELSELVTFAFLGHEGHSLLFLPLFTFSSSFVHVSKQTLVKPSRMMSCRFLKGIPGGFFLATWFTTAQAVSIAFNSGLYGDLIRLYGVINEMFESFKVSSLGGVNVSISAHFVLKILISDNR